jgi:sigma-B regulation protein RsbU (phosphoserine phosphatase)
LKGADVNSTVRRDGQEVGRIHARLNMPRLFRAILPPNRRDEGEVAFAIDESGEIHTRDADKPTVAALKNAGAIPKEGATVRSGGDWVVVTRKGPGDMTFGTARPVGNELRELRTVAVRNFAVGFGLIVVVFFGSVPLAGSMTRNLRTLMQGVQAVAHGDLSTRVPVRSSDEFGRLAGAFNQMTEDLARHEKLVVQQERLKRELELCRQIQNDMLPREPLRLGLAEVKGVSIPAREVGGDFFNYFVLPAGEIAVLVGDVSGKGVGAALLMANVQATLRARLPLEQDLARLADDLDRDLHANTPPEVYLTMFVGIVDPRTRVMRYVNAGHNTQFILRRMAGIEAMASTGRPLGLLPGGVYEERTTDLPLGDVLFFYTDGILDAENEAGEMFGSERLEVVLAQRPDQPAGVDDVLERVESALRAFRGQAEQPDDATMMALRLGAA